MKIVSSHLYMLMLACELFSNRVTKILKITLQFVPINI